MLLSLIVNSESEVAQSCLTLRDPMDCSLPGSSVHWIFQARVLEWGAMAFSLEWVLMRWWTWSLLYSEVSQTEKYKYCILTHTYGIYKDGTNDLTCRAAKKTQMFKNRLLDSAGEGEGGVIWENSIETNMYATICKTDDQWELNSWSKAPKASALGQPRGIGWRERWVGDLGWGGHIYTCWCMAKTIIL